MSDDLVKKKKLDDGDLDITPMIDVTFLLLIFFMVASTMQPTSEAQLAPALYGDGVTADLMMQISVLAPTSEGGEPTIKIDQQEATLEEVTAFVTENVQRTQEVLMRVDRDVPNGYLNEIFGAIKEGAPETELRFFHAVEEK